MSEDINDLIRQRDALDAQIKKRALDARDAHNRALWAIECAVTEAAREEGIRVSGRNRKNWLYLTVGNRVEVGLGSDDSDYGCPYEPITLRILSPTPDGGMGYTATFNDIPPKHHLLALMSAALKEEVD